jgi:ACS family hexuronate transporter-like MFS transporter
MTYRRVRWVIVALLFVSTAINYIDRQTLSILSPTLRHEFHLTEAGYANIVTAFLAAYTVMYSLSGRLIDRIGVRAGVVLSIAWWSIASMLTGAARSAGMLGAFRFLLGVGEPAIYPAGIKACGEWFPSAGRGLATGVFSSGSSVGAVVAPPLVAWIALQFGWRWAFFLPGAVGLLWIPLWLRNYRPVREHPAVSKKALLELQAGTSRRGRTWLELLRQRRVWALVAPRLAGDPVWYFYLFWLPDYLQRSRGMTLAQIGVYGWIPFLSADIGSIGGGAISDWLVRRGWHAKKARLAILIGVGCLSPLGALVGVVTHTITAIAITCLIAFLSQCWSTNTAALSADLFPEDERATVLGMMGTAGSLGGILFAQALALAIASLGYPSAFVFAALLHPVGALLVTFLLKEAPG